ncbi:MAG: uracil-DNA glycosylase [Armatimonadota bacterium]|nr:uracil-DNA glycosylase [Armatimonadota bacterium]MDR7473687.1 uracil-DNA glycosylase [Armatimonadota bacterium]MDR7538619.1 uracil-DNA glycosylase [Armatimonadota bacterium]
MGASAAPGASRTRARVQDQARALAALHREIQNCARCPLWRTRTNAVPGEGPAGAEVMIVGEAPGRQEDAEGRPFVGAAGRVLDGLLEAAGLQREEVYITNVVKSHPTDRRGGPNRAPRRSEVAACLPWLRQQLAIIRPRLVVTLGTHALQAFRPGEKIARVHGRPFQAEGFTILPLYHPAVALYGLRPEVLRRDIRQVRRLLALKAAEETTANR